MDYDKVKQLAEFRGTGTNLITMYLPHFNQNSAALALSKLNFELGTASNIKSKEIRKNVIEALKSASYKLKNYTFNDYRDIVLCTGNTIDGQHI